MSTRRERHRNALGGFGRTVNLVGDGWASPSPCAEWDARGVLEHVIGFHEVLILRPLAIRAVRPKDDPVGRWAATATAIDRALAGDLADDVLNVLLALTTDVLIHTWDLARAAGADETLDGGLVALAYDAVTSRPLPKSTGMFAKPIPVPASADLQTRLLAAYGRLA